MIHDGLWDPYNDMHMGMCGEKCAADFKFSRAAQDEYAMESTRRAQKAQAEGAFKAEIAPVEIVDRKGNKTAVTEDEGPKIARPDKIASLKASFKKDGTITAANASSINDGAAAMANNQLLGITPDKVNVRGGAVVLGHPIGASGARLLVTLLYAMKDLGKKRGVASLCIGGGEGIALIVERDEKP